MSTQRICLTIGFLLLVNILNSQSIDEGFIDIDYFFCDVNRDLEIIYDTLKSEENIIIHVSCLTVRPNSPIKSSVQYYLKQNGFNNFVVDGNLTFTSGHDSLHKMIASFSMGEWQHLTLNLPNHFTNKIEIEKYEVKNNVFNGKYLNFIGDKIIVEGYFKNGVRDSLWTEYYLDSSIKSQGHYLPKLVVLDMDIDSYLIHEVLNMKDTLSTYSADNPEVLARKYNLEKDFLIFPLYIHFKNGEWFYFDKEKQKRILKIYKDGIVTFEKTVD